MKLNGQNTGKGFEDIANLIENSDMWVLISLSSNGLSFRSSKQEEGLTLMALILSGTEEGWEHVKAMVEKIRLMKTSKLN